ncbi:MAG: glycosyltransferase family 2 protein [Clostridia bacterium]|nr:glycosyltransferase family 2 protein [Clostridia bacterium]
MFSIIIPVHNAEKTLARCVDSLLAQSFPDYEVLLIENGSGDRSLKMCLEYQAKDTRFRAYDIGKCSGPSRPRNFGLEMARGEWIVFLDSDDSLGERVLEMLGECFREENADVVFFGFCRLKSGVITERRFPRADAKEKKQLCLALHRQDCFGYTCCKAYGKRVLEGVRFDESLNLFEDEIFALQAAERAEKLMIAPEKYNADAFFYQVSDSDQSIMAQTHADMIEKKEKAFRAWTSFLGESDSSLTGMANSAVSFCRWYIYEHGFDLKRSYDELRRTSFFARADHKPEYYTFRLDYVKWRIKTALR